MRLRHQRTKKVKVRMPVHKIIQMMIYKQYCKMIFSSLRSLGQILRIRRMMMVNKSSMKLLILKLLLAETYMESNLQMSFCPEKQMPQTLILMNKVFNWSLANHQREPRKKQTHRIPQSQSLISLDHKLDSPNLSNEVLLLEFERF